MGGIGSGRHFYFGGKAKTSDYRLVDIRRWQRDGLLNGSAFTWSWFRDGQSVASIYVKATERAIKLQYRIKRDGDWQDVNSEIGISKTACHLGGARSWFICPCCGRKAAILYIGKVPACRKCYQLCYDSQSESTLDRQIRQLDKLRAQLGWPAGFLNGEGGKPKGMHWSTYNRLYNQHTQLAAQAERHFDEAFNIVTQHADKAMAAYKKRRAM